LISATIQQGWGYLSENALVDNAETNPYFTQNVLHKSNEINGISSFLVSMGRRK
jgi:hypothetical protein